jgi:glycosyltransferase involved in cell wall biosynthesis
MRRLVRFWRGLPNRLRTAFETRARHRAIARAARAPSDQPSISYGFDHVPGPGEIAYGGLVKFQSLQTGFPNAPRDFNALYLASSFLPPDAEALIALARRRGAAVAWNQNGVGYPAWAGTRTESFNARIRPGYLEADFVFFQSEFCRTSSEVWLGRRDRPGEVLYNPVDTERFTPAATAPDGLVVLLAGNQYERYRVETALRTFAVLARERSDARFVVTGTLSWGPDHRANREWTLKLAAELGLGDRLELRGPYTQAEAPELYRSAHLLLHTKVNDPCPGVVIEAMASGLPVVYAASGGVPELVGGSAGIGIPTPLDWEKQVVPSAEEMARAALAVLKDREAFSEAARTRAVQRFDVGPWIARHAAVFERLLSA